MAKIKFKHEEGALHVGGGRFFYANEMVEVTDKERAELLGKYEDLEEVFDEVVDDEKEEEEEKAKPGKQKASK